MILIGLFPGEGDSFVAPVSILESDISFYNPLISFLESAGFSREDVDFLFMDARTEYYPNLIIDKLPKVKCSDDYNFVEKKEVKSLTINEFRIKYNDYLVNAEKLYNVDKETIAAVLYVETKFGKFIGRYSIFNTLSSIALASEEFALSDLEKRIDQKYMQYSEPRRNRLKQYYRKHAKRKALLAKMEIANLIKIYQQRDEDILSMIGSYAGAFGYPQFMPSSLLTYGVDGNNDGKIDLFDFPDAINSIANYLNKKGWDTDHRAKRLALLRYNYSKKYVADVFQHTDNFKKVF